jgi:NAD(P)-dependent dehydrogenase (short-subunit alcohol dehydrogenase family)
LEYPLPRPKPRVERRASSVERRASSEESGSRSVFPRHVTCIIDLGIEKKFAFVEYPADALRNILAVNLIGPFLVSQAAARQMIQQGQGGRCHVLY